MSNLIIAIALWCGDPSPQTWKQGITNLQVNTCRKELFECTTKEPNGNGFSKCFKDKEIGQ